jgi:inosine-uridine nucleoside N-ribohydrolase
MPKKIIIDTDPGIDDAMAILFALASPEIDVIGLTTIFGNVYTPQATKNALRLLEFAGRGNIPVAHGAELPLYGDLDGVADFVHGANGLGDIPHGEPQAAPDARNAAQFIVDTVMAHPGEVTLVPVGPLTNIALALALEPRIVERVAEVVIMGGAATVSGNVNPAAEANIYNDPHAADRVFTARWPMLTMVGLDVTEQVIMDEPYLRSLRGSRTGAYIEEISRFYLDFYARANGLRMCHTHDPSAIAYVIDPTLFRARVGPMRVISDGLARGQTLWDRRQHWWGPHAWTNRPAVSVCVEVDAARLLDLYKQRILEAK